ncbi:mitochondrial import inner membrane translocase subunit Tim23 [Galendromus occidentalis]|uniref:Mitochondrial import inner membrane translocase subunit Tim23 n=1 Tax=Galendromus occidentalis TaxID=34638 RepID=A0AAJ6QN06_9ACAR|nr:mitochondrial import inner membrane translocase subunit Tim23 [Galendromus occidentalis]
MDPEYPKPTTAGSSFPRNAPIYSPYLNFDPAYINASAPEYILQEGAGPRRGRFDLCFAQIGSCVAAGSAIGGVRGLIHGLGETRDLQGSVKRSQLINYTMKSGSSIANKLGSISVMYSAFGVLFSYLREKDDDINTVVSGALTGLLYKSTAGLKQSGIGGAVGLGIAAAYAAVTSERVREFF